MRWSPPGWCWRPAASRRRSSTRWRGCSRCAAGSSARRSRAPGAPVYVDYAHTPDALEAAIAALRPHVERPADRRVRRGRRPRPGQAPRDGPSRRGRGRPGRSSPTTIRAARIPAAIRAHGARRRAAARREIGDRREAIAAAIAEAGRDDIVLIAGKGHEQGQIVGSGRSDARAAVRRCNRRARMRRCRALPWRDSSMSCRPAHARMAADRRRRVAALALWTAAGIARATGGRAMRRFPGLRASRSIAATCSAGDLFFALQGREHRRSPLSRQALRPRRGGGGGRSAGRRPAHPASRTPQARLSCSATAARERAPTRGSSG